jgi:uncharacterized protein YfaP (DUF2135 family)
MIETRFGILALGLAIAACSAPAPQATHGVITGRLRVVRTEEAVGSATIRLSGGRTTTANENGWFFFSDVQPGERLVATVEHEGYVEAIEPVTVRPGAASHLDISMIPVSATAQFDATAGGSIDDGAGARAVFPAGALVMPDGRPATGMVTVTIAALDPSDRAGLAAFPGDFSAVRSDGSSTLIETIVPMAVTVRQGDAVLNLAPGMRAEVTLPIPAAVTGRAPQTIEFWSLNPETGIWKEEGTAQRQDDPEAPGGAVYRATIAHMSWWNADMPITETTCVRGCVRAPDGHRVANVHVTSSGLDYLGESDGTTGEDGCFALNVKRGSQLSIVARTAGLVSDPTEVTASSVSMNVDGGASRCQDVGIITLAEPLAQIVLQWGERPSDLDSHFTGPGGDTLGGRFHVYYGSRGSLSDGPYCDLDTDDTSSYGPEITTLTRAQAGRYRFSVRNYSGQDAGPIEASSANVMVLLPRQGVIQRFTVPTANPSSGDVWRVVDLVADGSGRFTVMPLNTFANDRDGYDP